MIIQILLLSVILLGTLEFARWVLYRDAVQQSLQATRDRLGLRPLPATATKPPQSCGGNIRSSRLIPGSSWKTFPRSPKAVSLRPKKHG